MDEPGPDFTDLEPPVVVACSGGPDSVALLVLAADAGLEPVAVHVDHGLRAGSADDAEVVAAAAAAVGAPWRSVRVAVGPGANLEARARAARYTALRLAAAEIGATAVLVAHTADDQAETVLLNLLRGSALPGLAGMPSRRDGVVRPLLHLRRDAVRAVAAERGLATVADPTNDDRSHRRNWVRHEVLPMLGAGSERDLVPVLVRQAALVRAESDWLDDLGDELVAAAAGGRADLDVATLRSAPEVVLRRAVRRWLGPTPVGSADVERVLGVVRGAAAATEVAGGRRVARRAGRLRCEGSPGGRAAGVEPCPGEPVP